jgi:5-methylcytosine-specific restriction endonuclease McrA
MISLAHITDAVLLRQLTSLVHQDRANAATLLAHLAEVDMRRLYLPAGYPSMHAFCVERLRFSDDAACRRIRAARAARQFPALFTAVSDGRLNLAAVSLIAPHLTHENVAALIEAATHKRKIEVEEFLAERFALSETLPSPVTRIRVIPVKLNDPPPAPLPLLAAAEGDAAPLPPIAATGSTSVELRNEELVLGRVRGGEVQATPRFHFQFVVPKSTHDKLRHAQGLLSHAVPTGDLAQVIDRALDALISQLEVRKLGVSTRDLRHEVTSSEGGAPSRYIPAAVRRAAWERDKGRCTFVSITGGRCRSRQFLEFDHVEPFARGGKATVDNIRLRCRAHNQYEAERVFGRDFMRQKRQEARVAAAEDRDVAGPE